MSEFFDKLREIEEALKLCNNINNPDLRDRLRALIALNFSDVKPQDNFLSAVLGIDAAKDLDQVIKP